MQVGRGGNGDSESSNTDSERQVRPPGERFLILNERNHHVQRFRLNARRLDLRVLQPTSETVNPILWLELVIRDIYEYLISLGSENDWIGVSINSENFSRGAAGLSMRPIKNFIYDDLWGLISSLTQSNEICSIDDAFILEVTYINLPFGGGRKRKSLGINTLAQKSIVSIQCDDNLCLPRALVVGEIHVFLKLNDTAETKKLWNNIRDCRRRFQKERALELIKAANVDVPPRGCGFTEIECFQNFYKNLGIAIVVFDKTTFGSGDPPFFDGRAQLDVSKIDFLGVINILYDPHERHYDTVLNLTGASRTKFFCSYCNKKYQHLDQHECRSICARCFVSPACEKENIEVLECRECYRSFFGKTCFENHKKDGTYKVKNKKVCDLVKMCCKCRKRIHLYRGKHVCGFHYCKLCSEKHSVNDLCYICPIDAEGDKAAAVDNAGQSNDAKMKKNLYVFYDLETTQNTEYKNSITTYLHVPNLCVVQQVCDDCLNNDDLNQMCSTCGVREHIFRKNPVKEFVDLYVREKSVFDQIICIVHNAGGFDG